MNIFEGGLLNYVPYLPRALLALVPYLSCALRALVPYVLSCLTCLVPYVLSCLTCLVPYLLSCLTCLVPYVLSCPTCLTCLVPYVPCALRASCHSVLVSQVSYVLLYLTSLVPCVFSGISCFELYVLLSSSSLTCFRSFKPKNALIHLMSCSFHALCLLCFLCFSYLYFLQPGLRSIIVIDSSKDTLNNNDINTLYPLRGATYLKNEFQNLQTGFKRNRRGLGYV